MINKWLQLLLVPAIMATTAICAENGELCCDPCCDFSCECSTWTTYGGWIYWATRGCQMDYAINNDGTDSIGDVYHIDPDHNHGFYVGAHKTCDELCFDVRYTYYRAEEKDLTIDSTNGFLAGTLIVENAKLVSHASIQLARATWDLDYDVIDFIGCYLFDCHDCFQAGVQGGAKIAFIDNTLDVLYSTSTDITGGANTLDRVHMDNELKAYGAGIGAMGKFKSRDCFEFFANFGADLMVADVDRRFSYKTSSNGGATHTTRISLSDHCWRTIAILNFATGVSWVLCDTDCWSSALALGYEIHHWSGAAGFLTHQNESDEVTFDRYVEDLGFDGLFARFGLTF